MLRDVGCDDNSIHSLMQLAQLSELGRQEALALVKKVATGTKVRKPAQFLMGCCHTTMNRLTDEARKKAGLRLAILSCVIQQKTLLPSMHKVYERPNSCHV
jgi:hypothetical protein